MSRGQHCYSYEVPFVQPVAMGPIVEQWLSDIEAEVASYVTWLWSMA